MNNLEILKFICLVISIWFVFINICKVIYGHNVSWQNALLMSLSLAGFIYLQWLK